MKEGSFGSPPCSSASVFLTSSLGDALTAALLSGWTLLRMDSLPSWAPGLQIRNTSCGPRLVAGQLRDRLEIVATLRASGGLGCDLAEVGSGVSLGRGRLARLLTELASDAGVPFEIVCDPPQASIEAALSDPRNADLVRAAGSRFGVVPISESPDGTFDCSQSWRRQWPLPALVALRYPAELCDSGDGWRARADEDLSASLAHELIHCFPHLVPGASRAVDRALRTTSVDQEDFFSVVEMEVDRRTVALGHLSVAQRHRDRVLRGLALLRENRWRPRPKFWRGMFSRVCSVPADLAQEFAAAAVPILGPPPDVIVYAARRDPQAAWTIDEMRDVAAALEKLPWAETPRNPS